MDFIIYPVLPIVLIGGAATYLTIVACRLARWRHRRPSWFLVPAIAIVTSLLVLAVIYLGTSLQSGGWGKVSPFDPDVVPFIFMWACIFALIPAFIVVLIYRHRIRDVDHVA
jgi:cytochrome c biogenesis protein CcdA